MRNVQRTASCGGGDMHREVHERACPSKETNPGAIVVNAAATAVFNSESAPFFASVCERWAGVLVEVAQQDLFAQQPG